MSDDAPQWLVWLEEQLDPNVQGTRTVLAEIARLREMEERVRQLPGMSLDKSLPGSAALWWASRYVLAP